MGYRLKSLSEDYVDYITHTWTFALFLILSLLFLFIPVSQRQEKFQENSVTENVPTYKATCWCPSEFQSSHIHYTNEVCAKAFNDKVRGIKSENSNTKINIFSVNDYDPFPIPTTDNTIKNEVQNDTRSNNNKQINEDDGGEKDVTPWNGINHPSVLFLLLGICLRMPKTLVSIISQFAGAFNMEKTLECARKGEIMERKKRRELYIDIVKPLKSRPNSYLRSPTSFYILMKILLVCVIIFQIIVICYHANSQSEKSNQRMLNKQNQGITNNGYYGNNINNNNKNKINSINHCEFYMRLLSNVQAFAVQCLFSEVSSLAEMTKTLSPAEELGESHNVEDICLSVALLILGCLLVITIINTVYWCVFFLYNCCCEKKTSVDLEFLLHMTRANLSVCVESVLSDVVKNESPQLPADDGLPLEKL